MEVNYSVNLLEKNNDKNKYRVEISLPTSYGWIDNMSVIFEKNNNKISVPLPFLEKKDDKAYFSGEVELETSAIYHYYFNCSINCLNTYIKKNGVTDGSYPSLDEKIKTCVNFSVPDWAKGKIMYHIFVDRFNRGSSLEMDEMPRRHIHKSFDEEMMVGPDSNGIWNNDFYGGDLNGIIDKLAYIKSLGVSIIYLSPIVRSQSNHRYDTGDYEEVDPYAGTNEDLKELCDKCHQMGMKVILDGVFNHTGNDSKYFNELHSYDSDGASNNLNSTYSNFYRKHWYNGQMYYDYWWGMPNLPVCDGNSIEWQNYITGEGGVIDKWFGLGIDGLRLDVADELSDYYLELIRKAVKRNKEDGFILGEVWKNPMRMGRGYIESGKCMDSVMNYSLIDALIRYYKYGDVTKLAYIMKDIRNEYPTDTINSLMNFTSTHDISRALNIFSSYEFNEYSEWAWNLRNDSLDFCKNFKLSDEDKARGLEIYKSYIYCLTHLPGNLSIFYGDEIGIEGMGNLLNRKPFPWKDINIDLLRFFQDMGRIRGLNKFMEDADFDIRDINDKYLMFERIGKDERALITVSRSNEDSDFYVPKDYENGSTIHTLKLSKPGHLTPYGGITIKKDR